jgi:hypothetical protein
MAGQTDIWTGGSLCVLESLAMDTCPIKQVSWHDGDATSCTRSKVLCPCMQMGGYEGVRNSESMGVLPFTTRPAHGLKRLWFPRLECTGMLALRPSQGFLMHCTPRATA